MTEPREKETPGAALPETEATPEAVEAAVSRASDESLTAEPVVIPEFLRSEEKNSAAADGAARDGVADSGDAADSAGRDGAARDGAARDADARDGADLNGERRDGDAERGEAGAGAAGGSTTAAGAVAGAAAGAGIGSARVNSAKAADADASAAEAEELYRKRAAETSTEPYTPVDAAPVAHTGDENFVRIEKDHPMAGFYVQAPIEPDMRGNRLAGIFISLLATVVFAGVYSGAYALLQLLWVQPDDRFFADVVLPFFGSAQFYLPVGVFALSLILLVLIVGKAGWWAYVLGGFPIAGAVWIAATLGYALYTGELADGFSWRSLTEIGSHARLILAGIVAREVVVWFGAWIGARGRRVKLKNKQAMADYNEALAETNAA